MDSTGPTNHAEAHVQEILSRLRDLGYRATPQRAAILRSLATSTHHPNVEQIYESVRADFPMTSLATVYKTLAILKELGAVRELSIAGESARYDCGGPDFHPHLICVECKKIVDLETSSAANSTCEDVAAQTGYQILGERHDYFGMCPECRQER
jgi:Fur family peroxide stress response transcriptional regulator